LDWDEEFNVQYESIGQSQASETSKIGLKVGPRPTSGDKRDKNQVETTEISLVFARINEKNTSREDSFDGSLRKRGEMTILRGALKGVTTR